MLLSPTIMGPYYRARREGTRHIYAVRPEGLKPVQEFVSLFWGEQLAELKREIEGK
jgi:hypothetical protein